METNNLSNNYAQLSRHVDGFINYFHGQHLKTNLQAVSWHRPSHRASDSKCNSKTPLHPLVGSTIKTFQPPQQLN